MQELYLDQLQYWTQDFLYILFPLNQIGFKEVL